MKELQFDYFDVVRVIYIEKNNESNNRLYNIWF